MCFVTLDFKHINVWFMINLIGVLTLFWACQEIPITNPFDPHSPESIQVRGTLEGKIESPIEFYDLTRVLITLSSVDNDREYHLSPSSDGHFYQDEILVGLYVIYINASAHLAHQQTLQINYHANQLDPIRLIPDREVDQGIIVQSRVRLEGQNQSGGVQVRAYIGDQQQATDLTGFDGSFALNLNRLEHRLTFYRAGYQKVEKTIYYHDAGPLIGQFTIDEVPIDDLTPIVLSQVKGQLEVQVEISPEWIPQDQRGFQVQIINENESRALQSTGAPITITDLPVGVYTLSIERAGFDSVLEHIVIDEEELNVQRSVPLVLTHLALTDLELSGLTLTTDQLREIHTLSGSDLSGLHLVGSSEEERASLCGLNLDGVSFIGAHLSEIDLRGASIINAQFNQAILDRADLSGADLSNTSFFEAQLNEARFVSNETSSHLCNGEVIELNPTRLNNVNFSYAKLVNTYFDKTLNADTEITLERSPPPCSPSSSSDNTSEDAGSLIELSGVNWTHTDLSFAHMTQLNLSGSTWIATRLEGTDLRGSCLQNNLISYSHLQNIRLNDSDLSHVSLNNSTLIQADISHAKVTGMQVSDSNLGGAQFQHIYIREEMDTNVMDIQEAERLIIRNTIVDGASFQEAQLQGARLTNIFWLNADLSDVIFDEGVLNNTQFLNCDLSGSSFKRSTLSYVDFLGRGQSEDMEIAGYTTDLSHSTFDNSQLNYTNFFSIPLTDSSFVQSKQNHVLFSQSNLHNTNFNQSELNNVDLSRARIEATDFSGSYMAGVTFFLAIYNSETQWPTGWDPTLIEALGPYSQLQGIPIPAGIDASFADLTGIQIGDLSNSSDLIEINLQGSNLSEGMMENLSIISAHLQDANLSESNFERSSFHHTNLIGANLDTANFQNTFIEDSTLVNASADELNLFQTTIRRSDLTGVNLSTADLTYSSISDLLGECPEALPTGWMCKDQPNPTEENTAHDSAHLLISASAHLEYLNLSEMNLSDLVLFEQAEGSLNYNFISFKGSNLQDTDLRGSDLTHAILDETDLTGAQMENTTLEYAHTKNIKGCPISLPVSWRCFQDAHEIESYILIGEFANLSSAHLVNIDLFGADVRHVNFTNANLRGANMEGLDFMGTLFSSTNLSGADLSDGVHLDQQSFSSTNLSDAQLINVDLSYSNFAGANLEFANLSGSTLVGVIFAQQSRGVVLSNANLQYAQLMNVNLKDANLRDADLRNANLIGSNLVDADLSNAIFNEETQLFGSIMSNNTICPNFQRQADFLNCGFF